MHKPIDCPILYLDFDGVLHPGEVYRIRGQIVLQCDGICLFEWAPLLAEYLEPHPDVRIVLSTSWVRVLSFSGARAWLPDALAKRVIGATWHSAMNQAWWRGLSRYDQISRHAQRHRISRWLAVDDDGMAGPKIGQNSLCRQTRCWALLPRIAVNFCNSGCTNCERCFR